MEIKTVRTGIIEAIKADAEVIERIGADQVDYGLGRKIKESMFSGKGVAVRVVQLGRGEETPADYGAGTTYVWSQYRFHVVAVFQLSESEDEKDAEDYESDYDRIIRKALSVGYSLKDFATKVKFGRTILRQLPEKDTIYLVLLEVTVEVYESETAR